jgi:general secretion pathway protein G
MVGTGQPERFIRLVLRVGIIGLTLVIALSVLTVLTTRSQVPAEFSKAQLGCYSIAAATEKYIENKDNTKHEPPRTLEDLVEPPFGGPSFLRNGRADLVDPWGAPYQMERRQYKDGTDYFFIWTTAPNGTPISQFGIGPKNSVPWELQEKD